MYPTVTLFLLAGFVLVIGLPALVMFFRRKGYNPPDADEISREHFRAKCREIQRERLGLRIAAVCALSVLLATSSNAQLVATPATTTLNYTQGESITVSVDTPSLTLTTSQQTINVTTAWNLAAGRTQVDVLAGFTSSNALTSGSNNIPSSSILGQGADPESPCNQTITFPSGMFPNSCDLVWTKTTGLALTGTNTSPFKIRLSPTAPAIPAGTYSGTLTFVAEAE